MRIKAIAEDLRVLHRQRDLDLGVVVVATILAAYARSSDTEGRVRDAFAANFEREPDPLNAMLGMDVCEVGAGVSVFHHGEKVVILVDEYDEPIHAGHVHGYAPQILDLMRTLLGQGLKSNAHLFRAVVTGILRVTKESLFSGLNNLGVYTLLAREFNDCFGFTEPEVRALAAGRYVVCLREYGNTTAITDYEERWDAGSGYLWREAGWAGLRYTVTAQWGLGRPTPAITELTLEVAVNLWRGKDRGMFQEIQGSPTSGATIRFIGGLTKEQKDLIAKERKRLTDGVW